MDFTLFDDMNERNFEKLTSELDPLVKCSSCGAEHDINMNFCPYCGNPNEYAQENAYMDRLEKLEENLDDLQDYAEDTYKKEFLGTVKKILRPVFLILAIILLISVLLNITSKFKARSDIRKTIAWQNENYPKMNAMYNAGDFEEMQLYIHDILTDNDPMRVEVYNWEHFHFYSAYDHYYSLMQIEIKAKERSEYPESVKDFLFNDALELVYGNYETQLRNGMITEKDYGYIKEYQEYTRDYMKRHFGIENLDEVAGRCALKPPAIGFDMSSIREIIDEYKWVDNS